ncbi:ATP-binding protein [Akkermansiaceae bacterium]|nr:ATP-binding protein [Akkermansiaceae bacterium]MDB4508452.1 ATP-binding protein [Akkermansiaceae bacterium]
MQKLSVITGAAGVGKSTYGKKLAAECHACFLDSDTVTEDVVRAGMLAAELGPNDRDSPEYRRFFRDAVYEALYRVASENLPQIDVVMVGPFTSEIQNVNWPIWLSEHLKCEVEVCFVTCDEETRQQRIRDRSNPRDEWKIANWGDYLAKSSVCPPVFDYQMIKT